jgi:uncharacterized protein
MDLVAGIRAGLRAGAWAVLAFALGGGALPGLAGEAIPHGQGLLFEVEREGAPASHVFGTMHSADPEIIALPEPVEEVFRVAAAVGVEVVQAPATEAALREAMLLGAGRDLEALVGPELFGRVTEAGATLGLPARHLRTFKPWALVTLFSLPRGELVRRRGEPPLDVELQRRAEDQGLPVFGLETAAEQIEVFDGLELATQVELLEVALDQRGQIEGWWRATRRAYLLRDTASLYGLMLQQSAAGDPELAAHFVARLLDRRNERMVERMAPPLAAGRAFIAVGALHLPGERGVLRLLQEQGYEVTRVY